MKIAPKFNCTASLNVEDIWINRAFLDVVTNKVRYLYSVTCLDAPYRKEGPS